MNRICILAITIIACSCTRQPNLSVNDIVGTYSSPPCPNLIISRVAIQIEKNELPFQLINIKGDDILLTSNTPVFETQGEACILKNLREPRYNPIKVIDGRATLDILSADLMKKRTYYKL